jgi:signal transduction histidine kinase
MSWLQRSSYRADELSGGETGRRAWIVAALAIAAVAAKAFAHRFLGTDILISHVFYVPAVLAAIWWGWRGLWVGIVLAAVVVVSHLVLLPGADLTVEGGRAVMIAGISVLTAGLSERIAERDRVLRRTTLHLEEVTRELALAEDRQRREFAAALHDQLGQDLIAVKIGVGMLREEVGAAQSERLEKVLSLVDQAIIRVRTLTFDTCPPVLYERGLVAALEWMCDAFQERTGIRTRLQASPSVTRMDEEILGLVFRAVRELLQNVARHAQATAVQVIVDEDDQRLRIGVTDDGIGFIPDEVLSTNSEAKGFGIFSIKRHLRYLRGRLEIESAPGEGTRCTMYLPLAGDSGEGGYGDDLRAARG